MFGKLNKAVRAIARINDEVAHIRSRTDELRASTEELIVRTKQVAAGLTSLRPPEPFRALNFEYSYNPRSRDWSRTRANLRLQAVFEKSSQGYADLMGKFVALLPDFERISVEKPENAAAPHWVNGWMGGLDSISLYGLLVQKNPATYVEVGSGNSTKFARQAIRDHGLRTRIVSIDPNPRSEIDGLCDDIIRVPCENVPSSFFESLTPEDMLFVDNSHRSLQNSDVTIFFMEVLPSLAKGTLVGLHDIHLPKDYPSDWQDRFYNEQYLLAAYIFGGMDGGRIPAVERVRRPESAAACSARQGVGE